MLRPPALLLLRRPGTVDYAVKRTVWSSVQQRRHTCTISCADFANTSYSLEPCWTSKDMFLVSFPHTDSFCTFLHVTDLQGSCSNYGIEKALVALKMLYTKTLQLQIQDLVGSCKPF